MLTRYQTDLLPYVGPLRGLYKDLVKNKRHIQQKIETVAIPDIEVLTGYSNRKSSSERCTSLSLTSDLAGNMITDIFNGGEGAKLAKEKIAQLSRSWSDPIFDEADLSKIKNMALQELKEKRLEAQRAVLGSEALTCPQFLKHVSQSHVPEFSSTVLSRTSRRCPPSCKKVLSGTPSWEAFPSAMLLRVVIYPPEPH